MVWIEKIKNLKELKDVTGKYHNDIQEENLARPSYSQNVS